MRVFYSDTHQAHAPESYSRNGKLSPYKDAPARIASLLQVVEELGLDVAAPADFGLEPILKLHSADYLTFLRTAHARWQAFLSAGGGAGTDLACADRYSVRGYQNRLPSSIQGQVGYYLSGSAVPVGASTYAAVIGAAHTALAGAQALRQGERAAYALCRPPGHHAYRDLAGGYCYLNNTALAAEHLRQDFARVAVLDIDVHHGNGTQGLFYERSDVFFASVHADPNHAYPFYSGYADERGARDGEGRTLNLPLPLGTQDRAFIDAINQALGAIDAFAPEAFVISLGLDAHRDDPQGLFAVSTECFGRIGEQIARLRRPTLLVQEGGYGVGEVGNSLAAFLAGFGVEKRRAVPAGVPSARDRVSRG